MPEDRFTARRMRADRITNVFELAVLLNRYADRSAAQCAPAVVLSFQNPSKGPRTVSLELGGERVSFGATYAGGCDVGDSAEVELRGGAFGARWLHGIRRADR